MKERRVVITGIGAITPIGTGVEGLWEGLRRRESAVRCITRFDPSMFKSRIAGEVPDFAPSDHIEERRVRRLDRFSQFSVAATRMALTDADLDPAREDMDRIGATMGTALGGVAHGEGQYRNFMQGGPRAVDPALALTVFAGAASCNIAIEFGFTGPNSTNGMSCASGAIAIGEAFRAITRGEADVMVAGGAEAPLAPLCFGAFAIIRAMSTRNDDPGHASRPFDQGRDGFVMAEGAAVLVLEERGRALARGAPVYAEICGFGLTNDAASHDGAPARWQAGSAGNAERADRSPSGAARGGLHQRPRLLDSAQRPPPETSSMRQDAGRTPTGRRSAGPRGAAVTRSERAAPSRQRSVPWPVTVVGCHPRSIWTAPIRCATCPTSIPTECGCNPITSSATLSCRAASTPASSSGGSSKLLRFALPSLTRRLTAEALGTFGLVFVGAAVVVVNGGFPNSGIGLIGIALAHAIVLSVMITATMTISGGHLNPAVTIGLPLRRRIDPVSAVAYIAVSWPPPAWRHCWSSCSCLLRQCAMPCWGSR